jgi:hypothetical protein
MLDYYYEILQINLTTSSNYTLQCNSTIKIYGYLYQYYFNPYDPQQNLLAVNKIDTLDNQFKMTSYLEANITYVLVVATSDNETVDAFSLMVFGPNNVTFNRISKCDSLFCFNSNFD